MNETPELQFSSNEEENKDIEVAPTFTNTRSSRSRRSINILLESLKVSHESEEDCLETYQERLNKELKDWKNIYVEHLRVFSESPPTIGVEALSAENRTYLEAAPPLQIFHKESLKFRKRAKFFLEAEYLPMQEKIDRMLDICDFLKETTKEQLLNEREALNHL